MKIRKTNQVGEKEKEINETRNGEQTFKEKSR